LLTPAGAGFEVGNQPAQRKNAWIGHQLTIASRSKELLTSRSGTTRRRSLHGTGRPDHTTARVMLHPVLQHQTLVAPCSMDQAAMSPSLFLRE
jgi:hypothetical protein